MISFAKKEDVAALKKLWLEAFGEAESANMFYEIAFSEATILIYQLNNEIVSMLHYIPCCYQNDSTSYNGVYLYALATNEKYRGQGIMGQMIKEAMKQNSNKDFIYLIPASEKLYNYYSRFGFERKIYWPFDIQNLSEAKNKQNKLNLHFSEIIERYTSAEIQIYGADVPVQDNDGRGLNGVIYALNEKFDVQYMAGLVPY